ncbi:hypothetical protein Esi_0133_0042 [Ectocarpus siliculosus]|uniref:Uncharacterized protein n=1 Tax=Ectocarpus siliculosus TaxID=2880 RepID=D7FJE2_ECTSI|nr:hypothetical protein Esi_0133_0042 [Ectocarpus siliculosus]|eukprot:CBJ29045.1 hypothetical protein Esi_0133_0042 [Ectocarpus siliculosus]
MNEIGTGGEDVGREQTSQRLEERTDINQEKASLTAKHDEPTIDATEEEKEAGLVLTELFTLGVEDDVVSDSEDDHSDRALAASTTATEAQGPRIEEQGKDNHEQEAQARSSARGMEGGQTTTTNSRRSQSPTTQAMETHCRMMMNGIASSVDVASGLLQESAGEVLRCLVLDVQDTERTVAEQLQSVQPELSGEACTWLKQQAARGLDRGQSQAFELRLAGIDTQCLASVAKAFQDQRAAIERRMKETIDEMVSAFDRHLEDSAASTKQNFRWMKRRYREKIDINRAASRIELKDTILLDKCILEDKTKEIRDQYKEEVGRLRVEFQLERSTLRKQCRELEQSVEVLRLEKMQAEEDALQAHRYIEALEDGAPNHSEDGSVRSHKHSPRGGRSPRGGGHSRHASRNGSAQNSRHPSHHMLQRQESLNPGTSPSRHAFLSAGNGASGSPRSPRHMLAAGGHAGGRLSPRGASKGGASTLPDCQTGRGVGVGATQEAAVSPRGAGSAHNTGRGIGSRQNTGRMASGQNTGRNAFLACEDNGGNNSSRQLINPTARHEEARQRFENDVASKLMQVIEKKKLANLEEELADEIKNREAANARLAMMEQVIPKLHEDLKNVQAQLVQSRMETNELRKINTVMTTDLAQAASSEGQVRIRDAAAVREAETTLRDHPIGNAAAVAGGAPSFRHAAGAVVGAIRFSTRQLAGAGREPRAGPAQQQDTVALRKAKEMGQWVVQNPPEEHQEGEQEEYPVDDNDSAEDRELVSKLKRQISALEDERRAPVAGAAGLRSDMDDFRNDDGGKERAYTSGGTPNAGEETLADRRFASIKFEVENLKEVRRDLESKIAKMQVESDENSFLRRRLEAIERTTLKLNIGGVSNDLQILRERLELEAAEVSRLRGTVAALQNDKVMMTEEKASLEYDIQRLAQFKAEFENLADISINDSESNGLNGDSGTAGGAVDCGDGGKWKQRAKKLQQYIKWQLAEAETQAQRDRAQMALKSRSHEILMAEMAVLVKRYRRERGRLYEVNRTLLQQLAELDAQSDHDPRRRKVHTAGPPGVTANGQPTNPKYGRGKAREWAITGGGGLRHHQGAKVVTDTTTLSSVALVPTHTIENTPAVVAAVASARRKGPAMSASAAALLTAGEERVAGARNGGENDFSRARPRTSTGCESRARNRIGVDLVAKKRCDRRGRKEKASLKKEVETLARQLRSGVREEFFGPLSQSARERAKDMSAATKRHTTRDPMILAKPLSAITGSVLTNVPLPARVATVGGEMEPSYNQGRTSRSWSRPTRCEQNASAGGYGDGYGHHRGGAGAFW